MLLFSVYTIVQQYMLIIGKKDNLVLWERTTQGLDNTSITAEAMFSINFTNSKKCFILS